MSASQRHLVFTSFTGTECDMRLCQEFWKKPLPIVKTEASEQLKVDVNVKSVFYILSRINEVLVRKEYTELAQHIQSKSSQENPHCRIFLTGHPGVGKSFFMQYLFLYCLSIGQPVFFLYTDTHMVYYDETGGYRSDLSSTESHKSMVGYYALKNCWVLADVHGDWVPSEHSWMSRVPTFVLASSPDSTREYRFQKRYSARTWIMQPWTDEEIDAARRLKQLANATIAERFQYAGPVARELLQRHHSNDRKVNDSIEALSRNHTLAVLLCSGSRLSTVPIYAFYDVFLVTAIERVAGGTSTLDRRFADHTILSQHISDLLVGVLDRRGRLQTQWAELMVDWEHHPSALQGRTRDMIFKSVVHRYFESSPLPHGICADPIESSVVVVVDGGGGRSLAQMRCDPPGDPSVERPVYFRTRVTASHCTNTTYPLFDAIILTSSSLHVMCVTTTGQAAARSLHQSAEYDPIVEWLEREGYPCRDLSKHFVWIGSNVVQVEQLVSHSSPDVVGEEKSVPVEGFVFDVSAQKIRSPRVEYAE